MMGDRGGALSLIPPWLEIESLLLNWDMLYSDRQLSDYAILSF